MVAFGKVLRTMRQRKRVSQTVLADRANTNQRYISELETGFKTGPSEHMIFRLAIGLGADLWEADLLRMARGFEPLAPDWRDLRADDIRKLLEDYEKGDLG